MNAASTAPGKLTGEQYHAAAEAIRAGRVANLEGGRTAASLEELDAIRDWPVANVVDTSRAFEHMGTTPEVVVPNLIDTAAANALPLSDPELVARTSPPGTSATALNTADLPPEGGLKAPEGAVPDGTPVNEATKDTDAAKADADAAAKAKGK